MVRLEAAFFVPFYQLFGAPIEDSLATSSIDTFAVCQRCVKLLTTKIIIDYDSPSAFTTLWHAYHHFRVNQLHY